MKTECRMLIGILLVVMGPSTLGADVAEVKDPLYYLRSKDLEIEIAEVNPESILFSDFTLSSTVQPVEEPSDTVVFFKSFGYLYFVDPVALSLKWRTQNPYSQSVADLARSIHQTRTAKGQPLVFFPSADGMRILCVDGRSGTSVWQTYLADRLSTDLIFRDEPDSGGLYAALADGTVVKIDPLTGRFMENRARLGGARPVHLASDSGDYVIVSTDAGATLVYRAADLGYVGLVRLDFAGVNRPGLSGNHIIAYEAGEMEKKLRIFRIEALVDHVGIREVATERIDPHVRGTVVSSPIVYDDNRFALLSGDGTIYLFVLDETRTGMSVLLRARVQLGLVDGRTRPEAVLIAAGKGSNDTAVSDFFLLDATHLRLIDVDESALETTGEVNTLAPATITEYGTQGLFGGESGWLFTPCAQTIDNDGNLYVPVENRDRGISTIAALRVKRLKSSYELERFGAYAHGKTFRTGPVVLSGGKLVFRDQADRLNVLSLEVSDEDRSLRASTRELPIQTNGGLTAGLWQGKGVLLVAETDLSALDVETGEQIVYTLAAEQQRILSSSVLVATQDVVLFCTDDREVHAVRFGSEAVEEICPDAPKVSARILPKPEDMLGIVAYDSGVALCVGIVTTKGIAAYVLSEPKTAEAQLTLLWRYESDVPLDRMPVLYEGGYDEAGDKAAVLYLPYQNGRIVAFDPLGFSDGRDDGRSDAGKIENPTADIVEQYFTRIANMTEFAVNNYFFVIATGNTAYLVKRNTDSEIRERAVSCQGLVTSVLALEDLIVIADDTHRLNFVSVGVSSRLNYRYSVILPSTCEPIPIYLDRRYIFLQTVDARTYLFDPAARGSL